MQPTIETHRGANRYTLLVWRGTPHGTRYIVQESVYPRVYERIPPSLYTRTSRGLTITRLMPVRWCGGYSEHHLSPVYDHEPLFGLLEELHCKRVLRAVPRLVMALYERIDDSDIVRLIIGLYTGISK